MQTRHKAFTLIEILIAVMLTGLLTTLALAPVVITVRRVVETQEEYADLSALSRTLNFIQRDLSGAVRLSPNVLTIQDHESLNGNDDDVLMIMTTSPTVQNLPAGTVVYRIAEGGILHSDIIPGLYRWIFPGKLPNMIKTDTLDPEEAQLVLPDVNEFCVEVPTGSHKDDRKKDYMGQLPSGIYIKIARYTEEDTLNMTMTADERRADELESYIVFP